MWRIRMFFRKIKNLWRWFPTIWKDEDWDHSFIVDILIKKLEHQRDYQIFNGNSVDNLKYADEMQQAIDGLKKTKDEWEFYELPAIEALDQKWGKGKFRFEDIEGSDYKQLFIDRENIKIPEDQELYDEEYKKTMSLARKKYTEDKRNVYLFIADNIDKWWD